MITITLHSYDIELAELIIMKHCQLQNPSASNLELMNMLRMPRSTFYRKIKYLDNEEFAIRLKNAGYEVEFTEVKKLTFTFKPTSHENQSTSI